MATAVGLVSYIFTGFGLLTPDAPIVEITTGKLQGIMSTSRGGRQYYEYLGIPYAKSPLGDLRFEPPVPIERWKGTFKAKQYGRPCIQYDVMVLGNLIGDEDCLFINVYTPQLTGKLPVLVNFHGGNFAAGDSKDYGAKYFMDEDIVVVTMNFRLYALGFLNTGDDLIRGNMGLKDQNMALRWVQENIRKFGGDPDRVTIMGSGTGGVSVHYHILSPLSKGLFGKAISQSGNAACPWAFVGDPSSQARKFGKRVNCPTRNSTALVRCLKKKKARELVLMSQILMSPVHSQEDFFTGTVEAVKREDSFLTENPFDIMELGNFNKVPWIVGVNSGEGGYKISRFLAHPEIQAHVGRRWKEYSPILAHYDPNKLEVTSELRLYYFRTSKYFNPGYDLENLIQMINDANYFHPLNYAANRHARLNVSTYLYFFTYKPIRFPSTCSSFRAIRPDDWIPSELKVVAAIAQDMSKKYVDQDSEQQDLGICPEQQTPLLWNSNIFSEIWKSSPDYYFSRALISTIADFVENDGSRVKFDGLPWPPTVPKKLSYARTTPVPITRIPLLNGTPRTTPPPEPPIMYMKLDRPPKMIDEPFQKTLMFWNSLNIRSIFESGSW